jgi:hypothetical protein
MMLNLIVNANQALAVDPKDPRKVLITTSMNGSHEVAVSVRDSKAGVSPESLGGLFDPVPYDQAGRHGDRTVHLPVNHRAPQRRDLGDSERASGCCLSLHHARSPALDRSLRDANLDKLTEYVLYI